MDGAFRDEMEPITVPQTFRCVEQIAVAAVNEQTTKVTLPSFKKIENQRTDRYYFGSIIRILKAQFKVEKK